MSQLELDIRFWYTAIKVRIQMRIVKHIPMSPIDRTTLMTKIAISIDYMVYLYKLEQELYGG